ARLGGDENEAAIFSAHLALLEDPGLLDAADMLIDQGVGAAHAWHRAIQAQCEILQALGNLLLAERANDLRDLEKRVLRVLLGDTAPLRVPAGAIVAAREITPSDLAPLVDAGAAGLCMAEGGATSHVAILARSKGLPCLVALGAGLLELEEGRQVVLDAGQGRLELSPDARRLEQVALQVAQREEQHRRQQADAQREALTRDGRRIEIGANVASPREAAEAFANGADGVGLLRTEFLFLERRAAPDEEEQRNAYQEVLDAMGQRKVIIRTIDVGGDKHLDYLPLPVEENPALGLRGIRLGQARPELLDQQLRALLRVEPLERCRILLPMVSEVDELRAIRRRLGELATQLGIERLPELGVMIEVPSAALLADQLAEHADFLSIGTNDLSQYALAMDRCHAGLADRIDALHPALLRLIAQTCAGAARHGRWVGVCGALASDPLATPVLVGLGVEELSVGPNLVGEIKTRVRQLDAAECRRHAQALLDLGSARAVRDACLQHWPLA
ncbi:TPA: phosphoenolpyruvate--protein phosphotransferase, partial [Pseudomonas aeruginosa]|nr:phosphoenolpyruvate--protein phosphotransferase [Pseudomonas aeruginosa]